MAKKKSTPKVTATERSAVRVHDAATLPSGDAPTDAAASQDERRGAADTMMDPADATVVSARDASVDATRVMNGDPVEDIDFIRRAWSGPLDPRLPKGRSWNSRALIDACRPYEMLKDFPPVVKASDELREKVSAKFAKQLRRR